MTWSAVPSLLTAIIYFCFAVFVAASLKGRSNRIPYTLWTIATIVWQVMAVLLAIKVRPSLALICVKMEYTGVVFLPITVLHFCAAYLESRSLKQWIPGGYLLALFFAVTIWADGIFVNGYYVRPWGYAPRASWLHPVFMMTLAAQIVLFIGHLTLKLRDPHLSPTYREQVRAIRRAMLWYTLASVDFSINYGSPYYPPGSLFALIALGQMAYAIVRHQLMDIQVIVRKAMVYSIASAVFTSAYIGILFATVQLLSPIFRNITGSVIAACAVTAFCHPLIRRVQRRIDHWLGRSRLDQSVELMKFSGELGQDRSVERARGLLSRMIDDAFRPKGFVIYRRAANGFELFVQKGLPPAPQTLEADNRWVVRFGENADAQDISGMAITSDQEFSVRAAAPLFNHKLLQGFILLGEKRIEEPYTEQDLILLRIVANQAAVVLERPFLIKEVGAGFAHEIKTPLANIAMPAELCVLDLQDLLANDYDGVQDCVPVLVKRLEYIVDQALFASSRVDAMQQLSEVTGAMRMAPVSLRGAVEIVVGALAEAAHRADVKIAVHVPETLAILGDPPQIEILVTNLVKNAIEAIAGTSDRRLAIRATSKNGQIQLEVEDSGPGIQAKDTAKIFEPHFSTKSGHTRGMGLYIARRIAVAHQGTLSYERRGSWTVMRVMLPAARTSAVEQPV